MGETTELSSMWWKGFRTESGGSLRYFYTDEKNALQLRDKIYFGKNTDGVIIYKGYETEYSSEVPISKEIIYIEIGYHLSNYFGDRSGRHHRSKTYLLIDDKILQQDDHGKVKEVVRLTKELKGILSELN